MKKSVFMIIFLWVFVVIASVFWHNYLISTGTEVLLEIEPIDISNLKDASSIRLYYDIGHINYADYNFRESRFVKSVYVSLKVDENNIAEIENISDTKKISKDTLYLKGDIISKYYGDKGNYINVSYDIESYSTKNIPVEILQGKKQVVKYARVLVCKNGSSKILGLKLD